MLNRTFGDEIISRFDNMVVTNTYPTHLHQSVSHLSQFQNYLEPNKRTFSYFLPRSRILHHAKIFFPIKWKPIAISLLLSS